ncbi:hypothetical protein TSAR_005321, partial [Trichomalopsis sarcophagae]
VDGIDPTRNVPDPSYRVQQTYSSLVYSNRNLQGDPERRRRRDWPIARPVECHAPGEDNEPPD